MLLVFGKRNPSSQTESESEIDLGLKWDMCKLLIFPTVQNSVYSPALGNGVAGFQLPLFSPSF
jgi:hypothetical protein